MARLLLFRNYVKLLSTRMNHYCITCSITSKFKSTSSKSVDEPHWVNVKDAEKNFQSPHSVRKDGSVHNFEKTIPFENFESSDFSNFAMKYGEGTEDSGNQNISGMQVISVNAVLEDIRKDLFGDKQVETKHDYGSDSLHEVQTMVSENQKLVMKKNTESPEYIKKNLILETKDNNKKTKYIKAAKKKIILVGKKTTFSPQHHKTFFNELDYSGSKKIILENRVPKSDSNNANLLKSSENIKDIFNKIEKSSKQYCNQSQGDHNEEGTYVENHIHRKNCLGLQMLSPSLYDQIFSKIQPKDPTEAMEDLQRSKNHLEDQGLWDKEPSIMNDFNLQIPALEDTDLEAHFYTIAEEQCSPYKELLNKLVGADIPEFPKEWQYTPGWTRYNSDGTFVSVDSPDCRALVFDVEVCVAEGRHPTLATAVSDKHWYSWCSNCLISDKVSVVEVTRKDLIPLESLIELNDKGGCKDEVKPRVVVGHNVSYDRLRIREQYLLSSTDLRFVDTMSLHIAVSGLVSEQRAMLLKNKSSDTKIILPWMSVGCQNNLNDVYKFYCRVKDDLKKDVRNVFVKGTLRDVQSDFQNLMTYCANDVKATHMVLEKLLPLFFERFPHPVTFSGMLEMGSTFLPVTHNWNKYIDASEKKYRMLERLLNEELVQQAQKALAFKENEKYKRDPWLWNLDWSVPKGRVKTLPGYPNWYRKLCARTGEREGTPEPENMSTSLQVVPKLLRLTWNGFPLHHERKYGWGYLRPLFEDFGELESISELPAESQQDSGLQFPVDILYEICSNKTMTLDEALQARESTKLHSPETKEDWELLLSEDVINGTVKQKQKPMVFKENNVEERILDIGIPGVAFVPLPHKDGPGNRVGNPLAKDFLNKIEENTLSSYQGDIAKLVLKTNKTLSYWKNNRDRILSQMVIWNDQESTEDSTCFSDVEKGRQGVILPMVVSAGTITRRAVEPTWMTASNAYADRIGSELKAMVEAPPGYKFVGADVDSQELWIAAILGDAYFSSEHGATALGWMTLQGKKSDGSDMHSRTASMAGISRDHAKVINYGRIYGAGVKFIQRLLRQFNPKLTDSEAQHRATSLFEATKGKKGWKLTEKGEDLAMEIDYPNIGEALTRKEVKKLLWQANQHGIEVTFDEIVDRPPIWVGGSESHMFNCLEAIARSEKPKTPVLGARMTRALEPKYVDDQFMTSRVNWVVQSSAVDYLHLMLVSMKWLFKKYDISGRFCISIHDEVRYLVASEDCYRGALALQITNLLTRSFFALRLGFKDLPQSVAFFSSVDIDQVMRKEPHLDCVTPSNPDGLSKGCGILPGESLDIEKILQITKGKLHKNQLEEEKERNPVR